LGDIKMKRKLTGWGIGKEERPFSKSEYERSYIKKNIGGTYSDYLKNKASLEKKKRTKRTTPRATRTPTYNDKWKSIFG